MMQTAAPSPQLIFETLRGHQRTAALKTAVDLDMFTAIGEGARTVSELAGRCEASERGVRILCDFLTIVGFLNKIGDRYELTPDSAVFLDRRSPAYLGSITAFISSDEFIQRFADLTGIVRRGGPAETAMVPDNPLWVQFARHMAPMMALPAERLAETLGVANAGPLRVLDVAAGHGLFGIAVAKANPHAEITALDWKPVLDVAVENAGRAGVAGRYRTLAGDALTVDLGGPYDLVLVPNFLHHFDEPTCTAFARRVRSALAAGGRMAILDFVPDEDRVTPPETAAFSLTMLVTTSGGDAYTLSQYERMLGAAGFTRVTKQPLPPTMEQVVVATA
jgi:ubiquinone/menaquinone biosynthesis C-methylase UbiE